MKLKRIISLILNRVLTYNQMKNLGIEFGRDLIVVSRQNLKFNGTAYIGNSCRLYSTGGIEIGDGSIISDQVVIMTTMHDFDDPELSPYGFTDYLKKVFIGDRVWIGYRSIIMPGVSLGDDCIVGSGAVVTKSFPAGSVIAGNPAKLIKQRNFDKVRKSYLSQKAISRMGKTLRAK